MTIQSGSVLTKQQITDEAYTILHETYGYGAEFRDGQIDAIVHAVQHGRTLVVQKTGWGKSLIYFIATNILRKHGAGPTIIISPLLALMKNQIEAARFGVNAISINSSNKVDWLRLYGDINIGRADATIVSPEKLSDSEFMTALSKIRNIQLLVVDEAHSISDWGHDFRPDYQRVYKLIKNLPDNVGVLGTTATANQRVVQDIKAQLGDELAVVRGDLMRDDIAIQINPSQSRAERLAWLAVVLGKDGSLAASSSNQGVIYCLTKKECDRVTDWLKKNGIAAASYHGGMPESEARDVLADFYSGKLPVIVATIKLGMGYDKPDIRFIIHYQLPENLISYYQQIGRAGRDGRGATAVLMHGPEDEETLQYFIDSAFSSPFILNKIINLSDGKHTYTDMISSVNVKKDSFNSALKYLQVHEFIYKTKENGHFCFRKNIIRNFNVDEEKSRQDRISNIRLQELEDIKEFVSTDSCYMKYIADRLDAPDVPSRCGICANCTGHLLAEPKIASTVTKSAERFLNSSHGVIGAKEGSYDGGLILSDSYYSAIGRLVRRGKYEDGHFAGKLVLLSANFLRKQGMNSKIDLIVPIPSVNRPQLVPDFARKLAILLGVRYANVLTKTVGAPDQKTLQNKYVQRINIMNSVSIASPKPIIGKNILLVDDMTDSRSTFEVVAKKLIDANANKVFVYALVDTGGEHGTVSDYTGVEKRKMLLLSDLLDSSNMLLTELSSKDRANIISGNLGRISSDAVRSKVETLSQRGVRLSMAISELGQRGVDVIFRNEFKKYKFYRKFAPLPEVLFKVGDTNILTDEHAVVVTSLLALTYYIKRKDDDDSSRYIFISDRKLDEAIINIDVAKWISNGKVVLVTNNYHSKASIKSKKTFVSGSRNELDLNNQAIVLDAFYSELFYLCLRGDQIIVGDSEMGIDSRTIEFLRKYRYTNVVVYTVKQKPRVSIMGDWGLVRVAVGDSSSENTQKQQMKKDYDMAECADYGVAVFNPIMVNRYNNIQVSAGTLRNIIHMLNRDKTVPVKLFYWISGRMKHKILRNLDDLWGALERYKNEIVDDASTESKILHDKVVVAGCITTSEFKYKKIEQKVYSLIREGSAADNQKFSKGPVSTGQLCLVNDL